MDAVQVLAQSRLAATGGARRTLRTVVVDGYGESAGNRVVDLRHLRYFLAVYEEGSFTRAAERLHMAQPPLSRAIRQLETSLGVTLFERSGRAIIPTSAADTLAVEAQSVLMSVENARSKVQRTGNATSVSLRIGTPPHLPMKWLYDLLFAVDGSQKSIRADVLNLGSSAQLAALQRGDLDLGIVHLAPDQAPAGFEVAALTSGGHLAAAMAPDDQLARHDPLRPEHVVAATLVTLSHHVNPPLLVEYLHRIEAAGFRFGRITEIGGGVVRDVVLAAAAGRGVALLPRSMIEAAGGIDIVTVRRVQPVIKGTPAVLVWRKDPAPLVASAIDLIRQHAAAA